MYAITSRSIAIILSLVALSYAQGSKIGNCPVFPVDNIWNTPIDTLPVATNTSTYINTIGPSTGLHADFGSGTWDGGPIGIPYITVPGTQAKYPATFAYADESDPGPYAIPMNAPIEGGSNSTGDRHAIAVDVDNCILYELYSAYPQGASWMAGSGIVVNLLSNALRPGGWTSADAAGLPIAPGLARYDEVAAGAILHALRFTVPQTQKAYVWPARHYASSLTGSQFPPMGVRFRLQASYDITGFPTDVQVILKALKKYGMMIADNGSAWYISGAPDSRWNNTNLSRLSSVPGSAFEVVDVSSLMIDPNSGQARQASSGNQATMTTPVPGSTLAGSPVTFTWNNAGASAYWLDVGTVQGQGNIFAANVGLVTSQTVSGIPINGSTIYVRLWTLLSGNWVYNGYTYTAASLGTRAAMSSPTPGSILSGPSVIFTWSGGSGASAYWLDVGTVSGQGNIFAGNVGVVTSQTVNGIPTNGSTIYVRLWTQVSGNWVYNDYTYTAVSLGARAAMSSPTPGSALSGPSVSFTWSAVSVASAYWLDVGTVQGHGDISAGNVGLVTSRTVNGIPINGSTIYVRLWTLLSGNWVYNDYTYTAKGPTTAVLSTPAPGSVLGGSTITFTWVATGASACWLDVGTVQGQGNIFGANVGTATWQTVNGIPTNGQPIYVKLWSLLNGVWTGNPYTYTAASTTAAVMQSPTPGSTLAGSSVKFTWSAGGGASAYWLDVGTVQGQGNIFAANVGTATGQTVNGISTDGQPIYVKLWSLINGAWQSNAYSYTAF